MVVIKRGSEAVVHGIWAALDVHLDWVVLQVDVANAFNIVFHIVIFLKFTLQLGSCLSSYLSSIPFMFLSTLFFLITTPLRVICLFILPLLPIKGIL
jgi:hypothetical protein